MAVGFFGMMLAASITLAPRPLGPYDEPDTATPTEDTAVPESDPCASGYLRDGVQLPELSDLYIRTNPATAWGTQWMIDLLVETGARMREVAPYADPFVVGDISTRYGGALAPHISHRGGVDADIALYHDHGHQDPRGIIPFAQNTLDLQTNWLLISALIDSGRVDFILLDPLIISRIRAYVITNRILTRTEADRFLPLPGHTMDWRLTGVLRGAANHTGHMHVRILCDDGRRAR